MIKQVLTVLSITSFSSATITPFAMNNLTNSNDDLVNFLRQDIEENKLYLGKQVYSEYDGQTFTSQESLNEYILSNSIVESEFTSSNPSKIIKDYEHMTLDESKIYDIDMDKFQNVYRDAFGNIAKTSKNALDTYTNAGLVKEKYSYDGEKWFSSPEEAKINQKDNMEIHKSLYYVYDNKYYNAFNTDDINNLLAKFEEGYYTNRTKSLDGNNLLKPIVAYGTNDKRGFYKQIKRELKKDFVDSYIYDVSEMDYISSLKFGIKNKNEFRIRYKDKNQQIYKKGQTPEIKFVNKYSSYQKMLDDFKDISKWRTGSEGSWSIGRYYWYRDFEVYDLQNKPTIATITLMPKWSAGGGKNRPSFDNYSYTDTTVSTLKTYLDSNKNQLVESIGGLPQRYSLQELTTEEKAIMYDSWFEQYFNKTLTNFQGKENDKIDYNDIKKEKFIKNVDGTVYKDLFYDVNYDKGTSYSLIQSFYDWQFIKNDLLTKPVQIDGETKYELRPDFYATEKQLNDFLPLQGKFNAVLKYSYGSGPDVSSPDGLLLADTYQEAREKQFINSNLSLKKKYIAYDVFGNSVESGASEEEAIRNLQNNIILESKMVHKQEIKTWNWNLKKSYDSIISDGRYLVYKVKDPNSNNYIYYSSQERALNAALSNARINSDLNKLYMDKYLYTYVDSLTGEEYSVIFYNNDIDLAIDKIIEQINNSKRLLH